MCCVNIPTKRRHELHETLQRCLPLLLHGDVTHYDEVVEEAHFGFDMDNIRFPLAGYGHSYGNVSIVLYETTARVTFYVNDACNLGATWGFAYVKEAYAATMQLLLIRRYCATAIFNVLPRDVFLLIAKQIYHSHMDAAWK